MKRMRLYFTCNGSAPCITGMLNAALFVSPFYAALAWWILS
jgi:hypothetical protein